MATPARERARPRPREENSMTATKRVEWPPGSGRVAFYTRRELESLQRFIARLEETRTHRPECPAKASPFDQKLRDLERCTFCQLLNEIEMLHELKIEFGVDLAQDQ